MSRRCCLQLVGVCAWGKSLAKVIVPRAEEVELLGVEVPNSTIVLECKLAQQPWHFRALDCWDGEVCQVAGIMAALGANCHRQLAIVLARLRAMTNTTD